MLRFTPTKKTSLHYLGLALLGTGLVTAGASVGTRIDLRLKSESWDDLSKARDVILDDRKNIVTSLLDVLRDPQVKAHNFTATLNAIDLLGEIRAIEGADELLGLLDFRRAGGNAVPDPERIPTATTNPTEIGKDYPAVAALIKMRVPVEPVLKKLSGADSIVIQRACVAVIRGVEGDTIARYLLEKAVERETDTRKAARIQAALKLWIVDNSL